MLRKIFNLFKILRKLSISGAVDVLDEIKPMPKVLKLIFYIFSFGSNNKIEKLNRTSGEKLCGALQSMGTTFIKLGQFLATRPDIIGEEIAKNLEKLQDKLPAFDTFEAQMSTMSDEAVKGLQDKRNEAIYNGNLDESDYLGDAFRGNGYYFQKLVTNRVQNDLPAHVADLKAYISENDLAKNPKRPDR